MNNSMRSVLCMVCVCLSVPLLGVGPSAKLSPAEMLNQAADKLSRRCKQEQELRSWLLNRQAPIAAGLAVGAGVLTKVLWKKLSEAESGSDKLDKAAAISFVTAVLAAFWSSAAFLGGFIDMQERLRTEYKEKTRELLEHYPKIDESQLNDEAKKLLNDTRNPFTDI